MTSTLAIIGAGPLGIELAVAVRRTGIDYLHFDAGQIGQTISWFPPQTRFFSSNERIAIAGVPLCTPDQGKATREQYLAYLRSVVQQFDLHIRTYEPVIGITRDADGSFMLTSRSRGDEHGYRARKVVLATGGTFRPNRLGIPGEELPHVHRFWKDPHDYFRTKVLVIGGRNSAIETALRLHHAGARVSLSYRGAELPARSIKYWLLPEIMGYIRDGRIPAYFSSVPTRITPATVTLEFRDPGQAAQTDEPGRRSSNPVLQGAIGRKPSPLEIDADFVIPQIGYIADMSLARLAGVDLQGQRNVPSFNPETMETNIPGLYICGTAVAGTQEKYEVFIENGHVHVERILAHLTGAARVPDPQPYANPES